MSANLVETHAESNLSQEASPGTVVGFAGSRYGTVAQNTCHQLLSSFSRRGFSFLVGCAPGIDESFRTALAGSESRSRSTVHCAFPSRKHAVDRAGLKAVCTVSGAPSAAAALHRRTVSMVSRCTHLVLFPDNPKTGAWGKGSRLAFKTAVKSNIPVFVHTATPPPATTQYHVTPASLFNVLSGYWVVPVGKEVPNA